MGLPALLFPDDWIPAAPSTVDRAAIDSLRAGYRELLDDVRRDPPAEGSPAEDSALVRLSLLGFSTYRALGVAFVELQRRGVNQALAALVRKEMTAAEPERKLALRHVEQAVHRYGVVIESYGAVFTELGASSLAALADELSDQLMSGGLSISADERTVLRFQLQVLVALDVLDGALEELTAWAFRAIGDARRVEALPAPAIPVGFRGELARARARRSWLAWDSAEMARELTPWTGPQR